MLLVMLEVWLLTSFLYSNFRSSPERQHYCIFCTYHKILLVSVGLACSGPFWNKMESIFASVSSEDLSYLKQQVLITLVPRVINFPFSFDIISSKFCGGP